MDRHSLEASIDQNLPALLALTAYWNSTVLKIPTHCLLPYDERLRVLVPWLQQLQMESLGKSHGINGERLKGRTGMLVWVPTAMKLSTAFISGCAMGRAARALISFGVKCPDIAMPNTIECF